MIYPLKNKIMLYDWGSKTVIASLLGQSTPSDTPQAELWMGAHPKAPSMLQINGKQVSLIDSIEKNPKSMLGSPVARQFEKRLPFLFKILAVAKPLSIQAHPDKEMAKKGFKREEANHILIDAPNRNYRDVNHKPECICAITPFWALNGFRPFSDALALLQTACGRTLGLELTRLSESPSPFGIKPIFKLLMTLSPEKKKVVVDDALSFARKQRAKDTVWHWMTKLSRYYPNDIGILSPLFLNLICLSPGQAMYLPAGQIHAYLEGTGIELMANSDNVLRGGLTAKHIDVDELLNILNFESVTIDPIVPRRHSSSEEKYDTPAVEFSLAKITLDGTKPYTNRSEVVASIILCVEGDVAIRDIGTGKTTKMRKGVSVFVSGSVVSYEITGRGVCFTATVPQETNIKC